MGELNKGRPLRPVLLECQVCGYFKISPYHTIKYGRKRSDKELEEGFMSEDYCPICRRKAVFIKAVTFLEIAHKDKRVMKTFIKSSR